MKYFRDVKLPLCVLIVLFGIGSWVSVNGVWVELPILVHQLPESWNLPSYMTIIIQVANIGPLMYTAGHLLFPRVITEKPVAYFIIFTGCVSSILLPFLWEKTASVAGAEHSVSFLALLFLLSMTDCTSSVVFLPFMNNFKPQYMTWFYIGSGFSGLLPSIVSFAQGVGKTECLNTTSDNYSSEGNTTEYMIQEVYLPPLFSARDFFLIIFAMMVLCGAAFVALNHLPYCKQEYVVEPNKEDHESNELHAEGTEGTMTTSEVNDVNRKYFDDTTDKTSKRLTSTDDETAVQPTKEPVMTTGTFLYYLLIIAWVNAMTNGVLISIQSYACLPYGDQTYQLSVTLCNIINPVGCFVAFFITVRSSLGMSIMTLIGSLLSAYIVVVSGYSPEPPLQSSVVGPILIVTAYVIVFFLFNFIKVNIATLFRVRDKRSLLWCGAVTQIGSAAGSIVMFVTVNVMQLFQQNYPCT